MNLTGIKRYWAYFYNDRGEYLGKKRFNKYSKTLNFHNKSFNCMQYLATETRFHYFLWEKRVYQYNINNPNPLLLDKKHQPILDSEIYNIQLETKVARDLNDLSKDGLSKLLTPFNIIIAIVGIAILVYVLTGNKIVGQT